MRKVNIYVVSSVLVMTDTATFGRPILSRPLLPKFGEIGSLYHRLVTIVAISLGKPYAKLESGTKLVMYDIY
jgi:hypothetical protein